MSVRVGTPPDSRGRGPGRVAACSGPSQPSAPTATASAPASSTPFVIDLPIAAGDGATLAYGIWPYGVHGGGHALDGHGGFDVEYRIGAPWWPPPTAARR